ncbi:MAG: HesA/MoeB/ThiF family protein [Alcanivoracaceae bacterium]
MTESLTDEQLLRYSRQILLPALDIAGQEKLARAGVLVIGCGGLGAPASLYLAGAGVGRLTLVDDDVLETSNLHRQVAYREADVGASKAQALAAQLRALNRDVTVDALVTRAQPGWLDDHVAAADVVLDCSDNFATRNAVNAACVAAGRPLVSGAAIRFEGQLAVFDLRRPDSACYQCLYGDGSDPDLLCSEAGVVGPVVGMIGAAQALEAIKLLAGLAVTPQLHLFDGLAFQWRSLSFRRDPACPCCSGDEIE